MTTSVSLSRGEPNSLTGLAGWFFDDGCVCYPLTPSFELLARAAKAGNPGRVICFNPWICPRFTDFQDYFCGEASRSLLADKHLPPEGTGVFVAGSHRGLQAHTNSLLEESWVHGALERPIPPPRVSVDLFVRDMLGATARGIVPSVNLDIYQDGTVSEQSLDYMRAVRDIVKG